MNAPEGLDISRCAAHFAEVVAHAERIGQADQLRECLERLARFARPGSPVVLTKDFAPSSFGWSSTSLVGGLIFHRDYPEDPNKLTMGPQGSWSIHT